MNSNSIRIRIRQQIAGNSNCIYSRLDDNAIFKILEYYVPDVEFLEKALLARRFRGRKIHLK